MTAFTAIAMFASGTGLAVGALAVLFQSGRPLPAGAGIVVIGSLGGSVLSFALLGLVISAAGGVDVAGKAKGPEILRGPTPTGNPQSTSDQNSDDRTGCHG